MAKIPEFGTEQEMREFWDTHDSAEYFEDMNDEEVQITFK
ncbi:MAG: CopG family antitoxin [Candidatus Methanogasteraceae archaeon]